MKKVSNIAIKNGAPLYCIEYGEASPLENHQPMEIAHDNLQAFYAHEVFINTYGVESIERAINNIL